MSSWGKKKKDKTNPKTRWRMFFILCLCNVSLRVHSEHVFQARILPSLSQEPHLGAAAAVCLSLVTLVVFVAITSQGVVRALHCAITMLYLSPLPQEVVCGETLEDHANTLLLFKFPLDLACIDDSCLCNDGYKIMLQLRGSLHASPLAMAFFCKPEPSFLPLFCMYV